MRNAPPHEVLSVSQAADELGKPVRTLHHWITAGKIAAIKLGDGRTHPYVISREEVDRLKAEAAA